MTDLLQASKEAQSRFVAYNAKIAELASAIHDMDKKGEWESLDYMVLCAMQKGLTDARDTDQLRHSAFIESQAPDWDGD